MTKTLLPPAPPRIMKLPRDHRGFPVPWFVTWFKDGRPAAPGQGEPDFRVADMDKFDRAITTRRCWVCGEHLGGFLAFVIGPMCAINKTTSEPACHRDCAVFSATACPFLSRPRMRRNTKDLPAEGIPAPGLAIDRNPGVACVWITKSFQVFSAHRGGPGKLIALGDPVEVMWFAQGGPATRGEVMASIDSGTPLLEEEARKDGPEGLAALGLARERAMAWLPQ